MSAIRHERTAVSMGVDLGGTWLRAIAVADGRVRARLKRSVTGMPDLDTFLRSTLKRLGRPRLAALVVAARGVWTEAERRALAGRLRRVARRVEVLADAQAALLGALGDRPGLLVLAGTGSIVIGRDARGRWVREGGLGPLVGDEGSAFWLGREWLRATLDSGRDARARRLATAPDAVARIAALAPRVIRRARAGHGPARAVVRDAQRRLAGQGAGVARRLRLRGPLEASWAGGVMADRWFRAGVMRALARQGIRARWRAPAARPVVAVTRRAAALAGGAR